jgi:hypothetical protein
MRREPIFVRGIFLRNAGVFVRYIYVDRYFLATPIIVAGAFGVFLIQHAVGKQARNCEIVLGYQRAFNKLLEEQGTKSLLVFCALPIDWFEVRVTRSVRPEVCVSQ